MKTNPFVLFCGVALLGLVPMTSVQGNEKLTCSYEPKQGWDARHCYEMHRQERVRIERSRDQITVLVDVHKVCEDHRDTSYERKYTEEHLRTEIDSEARYFRIVTAKGTLDCR